MVTLNRMAEGWRLLGLLGIVLAAGGLAAACASGAGVPRLEQRAQEINRGVMCPVCPGESIDQSQHPLAVQMRGIVEEKLREGWTADQVRAHFVDGYGPSVLLEPPRSGLNLVVWVVPPMGVALAAVALFAVLRAMARPTQTSEVADTLSPEERIHYFSRVEATHADQSAAEDGPEGAA